jgi:hypothetical protein
MKPVRTPMTDALFGIFMQDVRIIRIRHSRSFRNKYYRFEYEEVDNDGYLLRIEPDTIPKTIRKEILEAFNHRLNALANEIHN